MKGGVKPSGNCKDFFFLNFNWLEGLFIRWGRMNSASKHIPSLLCVCSFLPLPLSHHMPATSRQRALRNSGGPVLDH